MDTRILPQVLQNVNAAAARVRPDGEAARCLDMARGHIADVAARRLQIENRLRVIQARATRGSGMRRSELDMALESIVQDLKSL